MEKKSLLSVLILLVVAFVPLFSENEAFMKGFHSISCLNIKGYVEEMASDKYKGRLTGTPEYLEVANWAAQQMKNWGISPGAGNGSWFQSFPKDWVDVKSIGSLKIKFPTRKDWLEKEYHFPTNYFPATNSDKGKIEEEVVYIGYGITAPELKYDDYKKVDVRGKIVLLEAGIPATKKDNDFGKWVKYSHTRYKQKNAVDHGAKGILYISKITNPNTIFIKNLIYAHIDKFVAQDIFKGTGKNYLQIKKKMGKNRRPQSFNTGKIAVIEADTQYHPQGKGCNVIGIIKGTDPVLKSEIIIIGAHLDGVGSPGALMPGAWDNASGVANILEAARALAKSKVKMKRSVMFLLFGGEECGLIGSQLYCKEPVFPKNMTAGFFNIDMAARGDKLYVGGVASYPEVLNCFEGFNSKFIHRQLKCSKSRKPGLGRPRSDGQIFLRNGFKSFSFSTFGKSSKKMYYHHPLDAPETLSYEIMEDLAKLIYGGIYNMANKDKLY